MATTLDKSIQAEAYKLVFWQLIVMMGLALVLLILQGIQSGFSALLGGLAYCVPNFVFVWRVFRTASAKAAKQFVMAFFAGETIKLFCSAILFLLIVKYLPVTLLSLLIGYIGAIVAFWIVSAFFISWQPGVAP